MFLVHCGAHLHLSASPPSRRLPHVAVGDAPGAANPSADHTPAGAYLGVAMTSFPLAVAARAGRTQLPPPLLLAPQLACCVWDVARADQRQG